MHFITFVALVTLVTFPRSFLGPPGELWRALKAIMDQNPSQIQAKSNQNRSKSNQNQSKSNQNQILGNPGRDPNTILGNPSELLGKPKKS